MPSLPAAAPQSQRLLGYASRAAIGSTSAVLATYGAGVAYCHVMSPREGLLAALRASALFVLPTWLLPAVLGAALGLLSAVFIPRHGLRLRISVLVLLASFVGALIGYHHTYRTPAISTSLAVVLGGLVWTVVALLLLLVQETASQGPNRGAA